MSQDASETNAHPHKHGPNCGHTRILHDGHIDYIHDGHLHYPQGDHYEEHILEINETNPEDGEPLDCGIDHAAEGHDRVPHGTHHDYVYNGRLHYRVGEQCYDHGPITVLD